MRRTAVRVGVVVLATSLVVVLTRELTATHGGDARTAPRVTLRRLPAFPGAQGFGTTTKGGRGGAVIEVTNLNDHGPGSLRAAAEAWEPRFVVFRVGGTIVLDDDITVRSPYLTIAGQTAPGGGITLKGNEQRAKSGLMDIRTHDVVIRFLRFRAGRFAGQSEGKPLGIFGRDVQNLVIDHCSFSWGVDENLTTYDYSRNITLSWNIISEALGNAGHPEGEHSRGLLIGEISASNITAHHNLLAHNNKRNPEINVTGTVDFRNNVIYNWGSQAGLTSDKNGGQLLNFVGNYYRPGPNSTRAWELGIYHRDGRCRHTLRIYVRGNLGPHRVDDAAPDDEVIRPDSCYELAKRPSAAPLVTTSSATQALFDVLEGAGASVPIRDAADKRVVDDVRSGTGGLIDSPDQVGGWPALATATATADADRDGTPDDWEAERGLDPHRDDSAGDRDSDGYTNLEEYVNDLAGQPAVIR